MTAYGRNSKPASLHCNDQPCQEPIRKGSVNRKQLVHVSAEGLFVPIYTMLLQEPPQRTSILAGQTRCETDVAA